eukprot:3420217-Rhodomonas_salina.1
MLLDWCEPWLVDNSSATPLVIHGLQAPFLQMRGGYIDELQEAVAWARKQSQIGTLFLGVWPNGPHNFKACGEDGEMEKIGGVLEGLTSDLLGLLCGEKPIISDEVVLEIHEMFVEDPSAPTDYVLAILGFVHTFLVRLGDGHDVEVVLEYKRDVKPGDVLDEDVDSDDEENSKVSWQDEYIGRCTWISEIETIKQEVMDFVLGDGMQYVGYVKLRVQVEAFSGSALARPCRASRKCQPRDMSPGGLSSF